MVRAVQAIVCIATSVLVLLSVLTPMSAVRGAGGSFTVSLTISDVSVPSIGSAYATVFWKTNGGTTSQVFYDVQPHTGIADYAYQSDFIALPISEHGVLLTGLSPSTTYYYRVKSSILIDSTEYMAVSPEYTFTTLEAGASPEPDADGEIFIAKIDTEQAPVAVDTLGNPLTLTGNLITLSKEGTELALSIPVSLAAGEKLGSFTDAAGLTFVDNELVIPAASAGTGGEPILKIVDETGELGTKIVVKTGDATGTGSKAVASVSSIQSVTGFASMDFTPEDPSLGKVDSTIVLDLASLPGDAEVKITTCREPDSETGSQFRLAAAKAGMQNISIAYTICLERTNLENGTDIKSATIIMKVGRQWVKENGGIDAVRIIRYDPETETRQVLETNFLEYDDEDRAVFEGISPDGLSVFALAGSRGGGGRCWIVYVIWTGIGVTVLILLIGLWRRRRRDRFDPRVRCSLGLGYKDRRV